LLNRFFYSHNKQSKHRAQSRPTNNGSSWDVANNGIPSISVYGLKVNGGALFAGTNIGVFSSTDNGNSWNANTAGLPVCSFDAFAVKGSKMFAAVGTGGYTLEKPQVIFFYLIIVAQIGLPSAMVCLIIKSPLLQFATVTYSRR
jgi:hypothetical protein